MYYKKEEIKMAKASTSNNRKATKKKKFKFQSAYTVY